MTARYKSVNFSIVAVILLVGVFSASILSTCTDNNIQRRMAIHKVAKAAYLKECLPRKPLEECMFAWDRSGSLRSFYVEAAEAVEAEKIAASRP